MRGISFQLAAAFLLLCVRAAQATVFYVDLNSTNPIPPYADWSTAATTIQDAVDVATPGALVLVTNQYSIVSNYPRPGYSTNQTAVYRTGGRIVYGSISNRVAVTKPLTVQSVNGPAVTFIDAGETGVGRCVYLTNGASLIGFTLTNGYLPQLGGNQIQTQCGGGVWSESTNTTISNCWITACYAVYGGSGAYAGTCYNCFFRSNNPFAPGIVGGGAYQSVLKDCTLVGNAGGNGSGAAYCNASNCMFSNNVTSSAYAGAGAYFCTLVNCTLTGNSSGYGGGSAGGTLNGCILIHNSAQYGGAACGGVLTNCLLTGNSAVDGGGAYGGYFPYYAGVAFPIVLARCTISNNSAAFGGGVYGIKTPITNCLLNNCLITQNAATNYGGGAVLAALNNCIVISNTVTAYSPNTRGYGGGIEGGLLNNCILAYNSAYIGGGVDGNQVGDLNCVLNSCSIVNNSTTNGFLSGMAGGVNYCHLNNCIAYYNTSVSNNIVFPANGAGVTMNYCCTTPLLISGPGNFTNAPLFGNVANDFHLQSNSPCINSGNNGFVTVTNDLDGNPRIVGGTVDIGAYEFQTPSSILSYAWAQQYGLPTDGSVDYLDLDGTGILNWQKSIAGLNPTNPASVLAMLTVVTNSAGGVTVNWQSVNTRTYYLQRATDLTAQPAFSALQSNLVGQTGTTSFTDNTTTNAGPYFYRVGVQ